MDESTDFDLINKAVMSMNGNSEVYFYDDPPIPIPNIVIRHVKPFFQGMPSHFFNFVFKSSHCPQMKVLKERISEWAHLKL